MSPAHTRKGNRRYRYYVSQAVLQYRESEAGSVLRISAKIIEDAVIKRLMQCCQTPKELLELFNQIKLSATKQNAIIHNAKTFTKDWEVLSPSKKIDHLKIMIQKVQVGCEGINISLSRAGMNKRFLKKDSNNEKSNRQMNDEYIISLPAKLKRCAHETKLIIGDEYINEQNSTTVLAIQNALKKALTWNQALITNQISGMKTLAKQEKVTQRYIAHLIQLAFLAPDIMEAILKGDIPKMLTLSKLKEGFSFDWNEQHNELGFDYKIYKCTS